MVESHDQVYEKKSISFKGFLDLLNMDLITQTTRVTFCLTFGDILARHVILYIYLFIDFEFVFQSSDLKNKKK